MNEGLEALKRLEQHENVNMQGVKNDYRTIEKELEAYYELENMHEELAKSYNKLCQEKLEWLKQKQALEIIKEKRVDIGWLFASLNCSRYNLGVGKSQALKKKEYDLLKEALL